MRTPLSEINLLLKTIEATQKRLTELLDNPELVTSIMGVLFEGIEIPLSVDTLDVQLVGRLTIHGEAHPDEILLTDQLQVSITGVDDMLIHSLTLCPIDFQQPTPVTLLVKLLPFFSVKKELPSE
jgi:hypothetical protein